MTTCRDAPATWQEYLDSEVGIISEHVMGNDPRPHYVHQTNIAEYNPADADTDTTEGGGLYAVVNTLLKRYDASIDRTSTPLVQLSQDDVAKTLVRQKAWAADVTAGRVSGYIKDGKVHVVASTAIDVPITGTTEGSAYAGTKSGWKAVAEGDTTYSPNDPTNTVVPSISGAANPGATLTATEGTWTGTGTIAKTFQWQRQRGHRRCMDEHRRSDGCDLCAPDRRRGQPLPGGRLSWQLDLVCEPGVLHGHGRGGQAAGRYADADADTHGHTHTHSETDSDAAGSEEAAGNRCPGGESAPAAQGPAGRVSKLSKLKMAPRKFRVKKARNAGQSKSKSKFKFGSSINWSVNRAATMRIKVERLATGSKKAKRHVRIGTIKKSAKKGKGALKFRGLVGKKRLAPGSYRVVVTATAGGRTTAARTIKFTVVKD